jgi:hypothetical protein
MAGLVPAIHVLWFEMLPSVDARHKAGHDDGANLIRWQFLTLLSPPLA